MTTTPTVGSTFFGLDISQFGTRLLSLRRKFSKRVLLLEFGPASLLMAEATLIQAGGVQLSHVSSFSLPPEALDRGVPTEPLKMARLIQDFCAENKIPAHRVAVVLPPELAFQRLIELPVSLTTDEVREYVLNPANSLQIPFPLTQTDFDLFLFQRRQRTHKVVKSVCTCSPRFQRFSLIRLCRCSKPQTWNCNCWR